MVIRDGECILRTTEQTHRFNCPYQLSLPTPGYGSISDSPHQADVYEVEVMAGDVILAGTDGQGFIYVYEHSLKIYDFPLAFSFFLTAF